ncbi:hypothetical protein [Synechococcus sp. WH 8016]|uniref:hypothetical protein n=1 Tax=Synechococcus sp. WH 8016 TaxID=166318 RepID=UPI00022DA14C|nr:hypothetical protein [Synechococcus sp. WH 8016]EHA63724.1 hypothetical protein Syn8016DRAFT_0765 [Synechococcus sp. WH 8016]
MFAPSPFTLFNEFGFPTRDRVVVISDSQMAELKKSEAEKQIASLEARKSEYENALTTLTSTIKSLKAEHKLIEPATQQEE